MLRKSPQPSSRQPPRYRPAVDDPAAAAEARSAAADRTAAAHGNGRADAGARPWQLELFDCSVRQRQQLDILLDLLGPLSDERCMLLAYGGVPGALHHHLRSAGGCWSWAELDRGRIRLIEELLAEPVAFARPDRLPYRDAQFQRVVVVNLHGALPQTDALNAEIARVLAPEGVAIIVARNGDRSRTLALLDRWTRAAGMMDGPRGNGLHPEELETQLRAAGLEPIWRDAYARFFTELGAVAGNYVRAKLLGEQCRHALGLAAPEPGSPTPRQVERARHVYRGTYPLERALATFDLLARRRHGYALAVVVEKPA